MRLTLLGGALALGCALAASAGAGQVRVSVSDFQFTPASIDLNLGDQVVWVWLGGLHTVTSGDDGSEGGDRTFNSGGGTSGLVGARFSWKSDRTGDVPYYCVVHHDGGMTGMLSVAGSGVPVSDFRISEVQHNRPAGEDLLEIANLGTVEGNLGRYRLAVYSDAVAVQPNDLMVAPGGRVTIHANANGANTATDIYLPTLPELPPEGSVSLYLPNSVNTSLALADQIVDFVQWGAGGQANEATAQSAGYWTAGQAIPAMADGHSLEFCGTSGERGAAFWAEVAVPNFGTDDDCSTPTRADTWGRLKLRYGR